MRKTTTLFKAVSDASRVRILMMLRIRPLCVCEVVDILGLANSTVSKHLSILRNAELIRDEKDGRWVNYRLAQKHESTEVEFLMAHLEGQLNNDPQVEADALKLQRVDRYLICGISSHREDDDL